jgi:hypothetical protein
MVKLRVVKADRQDVYRDIVRIPEQFRQASDGTTVPEGEVCKITVRGNRRIAFVILRGKEDSQEQDVWLDERTRNRLGVLPGDEICLEMETAGLWGQWKWAWSSSDPAYRVSARLALLSVVLGAVGVLLGLVSVLY